MSAVRIEHPNPNAGHEVVLHTTIAASRDYEDVTVSYYLLNKEDADAEVEDVRQFPIASEQFEAVDSGTKEYSSFIIIPGEVDPPGQYYLVSRVDPLDRIPETNEDDNLPGENTPDHVVRVGHTFLGTPDIVLEDVELDAEAIVLEQVLTLPSFGSIGDSENHHFGANVLVSTTGTMAVPDLDLQVSIEVPGSGFEQLKLWNRDNLDYVDNYLVDLVEPGEPNRIHLDVLIPEATRQRLLAAMNGEMGTFALRVTTNKIAGVGEWELGVRRFNRPDNGVDFDIVCVRPAPPPTGVIEFRERFAKTWSDDYFGVGLELEAGAGVDQTGAWAMTGAEVPVYLVRRRFNLFDFESSALVAPHEPETSAMRVDVKLLGATVYTREVIDPSFELRTVWEMQETAEARTVVWVGPVPIKFTAGATGTVGFETVLYGDTSQLQAQAIPYADASAFAEAKVDVVVASGGVRGDIQLLNDTFTASSTASVDLLNNGNTLQGSLVTDMTNVLTGPNGRIYLFANYPDVKLCKTFLGSVPCGVTQRRKEKTLVRFSTFRKEDVLFRDAQTVQVDLTSN